VEASTNKQNEFSYNGLAFNGQGIQIKSFIGYLENELNIPVYDASGLKGYYNIEFSKDNINSLSSIKKGLEKLGLELVPAKKEMEILFIKSKE
jgi:uncharacterized protein (TIGR03435 family)